MEHSGISVRPTVDSASRIPVEPPNRPEEGDGMTPAHVDQREPVEFQGDGLIEEVVQDPLERALRSEVPEAQRPESGEGRQHERSTPSERRELDVRDPELAIGELKGDVGQSEVLGREARELSSPGVGSSEEVLGEESQARASQEQIWQNTLKKAREWVAGSTAADDEEAGSGDANPTRDPTSIDADPRLVEERVVVSNPTPTQPSPLEEPEARDLHLEIGTISVTVEAPQQEASRGSRRTESAEINPARNSERSRLSRHYVRVG